MRAAIVASLFVARAAAARPAVDVPADWQMQPKSITDPMLVQLRKASSSIVAADATIYMSPAQDVQLTILTWTTKVDQDITRDLAKRIDEDTETGTRKAATQHVSTERRFEGDQLVAEQIEMAGQIRFHLVRRSGRDTSGALQTQTVSCAGMPAAIAPCEAILRGSRFDIPNPAPFAKQRDSDSKSYDAGYLVGQVMGGLGVLALLVYFLTRNRRKT
jgi:hypothetical protein